MFNWFKKKKQEPKKKRKVITKTEKFEVGKVILKVWLEDGRKFLMHITGYVSQSSINASICYINKDEVPEYLPPVITTGKVRAREYPLSYQHLANIEIFHTNNEKNTIYKGKLKKIEINQELSHEVEYNVLYTVDEN